MTRLDFVTEPFFECVDNEAGDVAFVKATHTIDGRDYRGVYGLQTFPLVDKLQLGQNCQGKNTSVEAISPFARVSCH
jgi:hypothetical protein